MPDVLQPTCPGLRRPEALLRPGATVHGLRAAQTRASGGKRTLEVYLFHDPPAGLDDPARWTLRPSPGGKPVTITGATSATTPEPLVALDLSGSPDTALYRLDVAPPAAARFDPLRTWLPVRLRPECRDAGDCEDPPPTPAAPITSPVHDYAARDWRSLRRALIEFLLREDPGADLSPADPTITLIELFAHIGDLLHYRLDRVATEAYLETARRRTSVRRHARLVDYRMGDGVSARTYVHLSVPPEAAPVTVRPGDVAADQPGSPLAFTIEDTLTARDALGEIAIYDWGEPACCLPAGATECILVRPKPADPLGDDWLAAGALVAFELVFADDPDFHTGWVRRKTAWPTAASTFREALPGRPSQVVRLVAAELFTDPLATALLGPGMRLTRVRWSRDDALLAPLPVGIDPVSGEVAVARANLVRAHHGRLVDGPPDTTLEPVPAEGAAAADTAAAYELTQCGMPAVRGRTGGPGLALRDDGRPYRLDVELELPSGLALQPPVLNTLLEAPAGEPAAVVEIEERERPLLRLRTGSVGIAPPRGSAVRAAYEVGSGVWGNAPANALTVLEHNARGPHDTPEWKVVAGVRARNPVPATGGSDPTSLEDVRRDAPEAFVAELRRAVLPSDHALLAAAAPRVQRAAARARWTGSWQHVTTLVDVDADDPAAELADIATALDAARLLGTEVTVAEGRAVGLQLTLDVCAMAGADPLLVRAQALAELRPGSAVRPGVFHHSRLVLGTAVYVSTAVAAVAALPLVDAVAVLDARRVDEPAGTVHTVIAVGADEVPVLDDDPARPERGRLDVRVRGGR